MYPQKPLPVLAHMPPHIKMNIGRNLDHFDRISLRNSNRNFRRVIRAPMVSAEVYIWYCNERRASVVFSCNEPKMSKVKVYKKNEQGWIVTTSYAKMNSKSRQSTVSTVQEGEEDLAELMIQDFKVILNIPNLTLQLFSVNFIKPEDIGIMSGIRKVLETIEPRAIVKKCLLRTERSEEVLAVLPLLDPTALTDLVISETDGTPYSMKALELHRFPNLDSLKLGNVTGILPLEMWWDVSEVELTMRIHFNPIEKSLSQLPTIIQHFRQAPAFQRCSLDLHCTGLEIKHAIGNLVQWELTDNNDNMERFHLAAQGSSLELYGQLQDGVLQVMRTSRWD